jgi:hypothetical protein
MRATIGIGSVNVLGDAGTGLVQDRLARHVGHRCLLPTV